VGGVIHDRGMKENTGMFSLTQCWAIITTLG
jgi:hypothetical protein